MTQGGVVMRQFNQNDLEFKEPGFFVKVLISIWNTFWNSIPIIVVILLLSWVFGWPYEF